MPQLVAKCPIPLVRLHVWCHHRAEQRRPLLGVQLPELTLVCVLVADEGRKGCERQQSCAYACRYNIQQHVPPGQHWHTG